MRVTFINMDHLQGGSKVKLIIPVGGEPGESEVVITEKFNASGRIQASTIDIDLKILQKLYPGISKGLNRYYINRLRPVHMKGVNVHE